MSVGALIPIRLDSSRLPGKALREVAGLPAVQRLVTQVAACGHVPRERIVICTTARPADDPLLPVAARLGVRVFRGSTEDLIDRMWRAVEANGFDAVVEIDGDDICADPRYMSACLEPVLRGEAEVACCADGLPLGAAVKAFRSACLETVFSCYVPGKNDTGFGYYLTKSRLFSTTRIAALDPRHLMPELRLTLDYPQDLEFFSRIYRELRGGADSVVHLEEICELTRNRPDILAINAGLDAEYWRRTRELLARYPLQIKLDNRVVPLDVE